MKSEPKRWFRAHVELKYLSSDKKGFSNVKKRARLKVNLD